MGTYIRINNDVLSIENKLLLEKFNNKKVKITSDNLVLYEGDMIGELLLSDFSLRKGNILKIYISNNDLWYFIDKVFYTYDNINISKSFIDDSIINFFDNVRKEFNEDE